MSSLSSRNHNDRPWKSSYCHSGGCVYVQSGSGIVRVLPDPAAIATLTFSPGQWNAFTAGIRKESPGAA